MAKTRKSDEWPTPYEYEEALLKHQETFKDPEIQRSELLKRPNGKPARLNDGGTQHVCVYRLGNWVVRCFAADTLNNNNIRPPDDIVQRYEGIIPYLGQVSNSLPFLTRHQWIEDGIKLRGTTFPFLKLPFVNQVFPLGQFLNDLYDKQSSTLFAQTTGKLAQEWLNISRQLEAVGIAHGDLDSSNILVRGTYPALSLHLIDYDGMYVPTFAKTRMRSADKGHANFQPTDTSIRTFGPEMDRFSSLIIYLSLRALEMNPSLWEKCQAGESCLLLGFDDFEQLGQSKRFRLLYQESQHDSRLKNCLDELLESQERKPRPYMPRSLSQIISVYVSPPPPIPQPVPAAGLSSYEPMPLAIPLDWALNPATTPVPSSPTPTPPTSPIPTTSPTWATGSYTPPTPSSSQSTRSTWSPPPTRTVPVRRNSNRGLLIAAVILIIIAVIVIIVISATHQSPPPQSSPSFILALPPLLLRNLTQAWEDNTRERDFDDEA